MTDDIIELRAALAEVHDREEWAQRRRADMRIGRFRLLRINSETGTEQTDANETYIAAANPNRIARLLDRLDAAERELESLRLRAAYASAWRVGASEDSLKIKIDH